MDGDNSVEDDHITALLEAARWAPSARNLQPLEYIVVKDPVKRRLLGEVTGRQYPVKAPASIVIIGDLNRAMLVGEVSDHETTTSEKGATMFIYMDAAAAIQNMLLVAHELGLGSLWISSFDESGLKRIFALPKHYKPMAIICLGRSEPDKPTPIPPRRKLEEIMHTEQWIQQNHDPTHFEYSKIINTPLMEVYAHVQKLHKERENSAIASELLKSGKSIKVPTGEELRDISTA